MAANISDSKIIEETRRVYIECGENAAETARRLGIARSTVQDRIKTAQDAPTPDLEFPVFPDEDIPPEQIVDHMVRRFEKRKASHDAHTWFRIKAKENKPLGLLFIGDPHIDDNGCDWPLLKKHIEVCRTTPGLHAINIGDTTNSWGGNLIRKYADQDTSRKTAQRLAEWLLLDSGIKWLAWLYGNHEHMTDLSASMLAQMAKRYGTHKIVMHDWEARFSIDFPNGQSVRIAAAHDFSGNSMWNPLHGLVKAARFGNDIDLLVCGHKHNWGVSQWELAEQGHSPMMVRVRGYKSLDDYSRKLGHYDQEDGASILVILDPKATTRSGRAQAFIDVEAGAEYLTWMRGRK